MTGTSKGPKAALGVRCHSGWAAAILVRGSPDGIDVVDRRHIELCDPRIEGSKQPFHAAEPMELARAEAFISRCQEATDRLAERAVENLAARAEDAGQRIAGCALLCASGRRLPPLQEILLSHALIHAAEGEFYRDAIARACEHADIAVVRIPEREAFHKASGKTGFSEAKLKERLSALGKALGPPWTEDQKLSALGAWLIIAD